MKTAALAALTAAVTVLVLGSPALAADQTPPPAPTTAPAQTAPTPALGLAPAAVVAWLTTQGLTPGALEQEGANQYVRVTDGTLRWILFFQSCDAGLCSDLQFSTGFANAAITPEAINGWNRDRRFLKAFHEPAQGTNPPSAVVQYDLFTVPGGVGQLTDHLAIWRGLLPDFARTISGTAPATAAPTPAPAQ